MTKSILTSVRGFLALCLLTKLTRGTHTSSPTPQSASIRLVPDGSSNFQILEVYYGGSWGRVCGSATYTFSDLSANVACRQLGYASASWLTQYSGSSQTIIATSPDCDGDESTLQSCNGYWGSFASYYCSSTSYYVKLYCSSSLSNSVTPSLSNLQTSSTSYSGILLVSTSWGYGRVCFTDFNSVDAEAACYSLGYPTYDVEYSLSSSGSSYSFVMSEVQCPTATTTLQQCSYQQGASYCYYGIQLTCSSVTITSSPTSSSSSESSTSLDIQFITFAVMIPVMAIVAYILYKRFRGRIAASAQNAIDNKEPDHMYETKGIRLASRSPGAQNKPLPVAVPVAPIARVVQPAPRPMATHSPAYNQAPFFPPPSYNNSASPPVAFPQESGGGSNIPVAPVYHDPSPQYGEYGDEFNPE